MTDPLEHFDNKSKASKASKQSVDTMYKLQSYMLEPSDMERVTKRIIGPYAQIKRKSEIKKELEKEGITLNLERFNVFVDAVINLNELLYETAVVLKNTTDSCGVFVYLVNKLNNEIVLMPNRTINPKRHEVNIAIREGVMAASHVAATKDYLLLDDVERDTRFSEGLKWVNAKVALCMPVLMPDGECYAVLELYRTYSEPYDDKVLHNVLCMSCWAGAAIHQASLRMRLTKTERLNQQLQALLQEYFCGAVSIDSMLTDMLAIMKYVMCTMRSTFYILDRENLVEGLMADMWDDGWVSEKTTIPRKRNKINLSQEKSPAAHVAKTGEFLNLTNAYKDMRFTRDIDPTTGIVVRTVLAGPILDKSNVIIGVCQLTNKTEAKPFNAEDEEMFKVFISYCSLIVHYYNMQQKKLYHESLNKVFHELIGLHLKPCDHELTELMDANGYVLPPDNFTSYNYHISEGNKEDMAGLACYMFTETFADSERFPKKTLVDFTFTVLHTYRKVPYHNADHAFTFTHTMFLILTNNQGNFDYFETAALMIAGICHDMDHPGVNNNYLTLSKHPLAAMYKTSMLEYHHYFMAKKIIEDKKLLNFFSPTEQARILTEIKYAILSTDLAVYFQMRAHLSPVITQKAFDWNDLSHRRWLKGIMMVSCDLSGCAKPFWITKAQAEAVYEEFYAQGDMERSLGYTPLSMMDRSRSLNQPVEQIQFLSVVVLPCLALLQAVFPNVANLVDNCKKAQESWHEEIEMRGQKLWKQVESLPVICRASKLPIKSQSGETHASMMSKILTKSHSADTHGSLEKHPNTGCARTWSAGN